ncbi:LysR family transcriptional regulator, partial [Streptomyces pharetrae]
KGTGEAAYETVALLPPLEATSPAARALITLLETGGA